jgi:acyl dehydratase
MRIFSEFKAAVGTEIGASEWVEITQDRISRFAEATCDEQWIHVDQDRARKELPGGKTIAHGLLALSLAPMFIRSVIGLKNLQNTLNYGADRIRYLSPVPAGSRIRGRTSIGSGKRPARRLKGQLSHGDRARRCSAPSPRRRVDRTSLPLRLK